MDNNSIPQKPEVDSKEEPINTPPLPPSPPPIRTPNPKEGVDESNLSDSDKEEKNKIQPVPSYTFKSSVRTMDSDEESIKEGKKDIKGDFLTKKAEGNINTSNREDIVNTPVPKEEGVDRISELRLGQAEKSDILRQEEKTQTKEGSYSHTVPPKVIVPPKKSSFSKSFLFLVLAVLVIGAASYWYFIIRPSGDLVIPTPTPVASPSLSPTPTPLNIGNIILSSTGSYVDQLKNKINSEEINFNQTKLFNLANENNQVITFDDLIEKFAITPPLDLTEVLSDSVVKLVIHDQVEDIGDNFVSKSFGFIIPISDVFADARSKVVEGMSNWETNISTDLNNIFGLDLNMKISPVFLDNTYKGIVIRYNNFPDPDQTIDYAIVTSLTGREYLVIVNSRETIYEIISAIDLLE